MRRYTFICALAFAVCGLVRADVGTMDGEDLCRRIVRMSGVWQGGVCRVPKVRFVSKANPEGMDYLEISRASARERVVVTGEFVRIDFMLVPERGCDIRCRAEPPLPDRWDGRMWGQGNSGRAGSLPSLGSYVAAGTAAVTTDLGTSSVAGNGKPANVVWPAAIRRDFNWRATHLMAVYGKRIVTAFYGRKFTKAYFNGGSTGGRQGIGEIIRFPEDWDGVISILPDNNAAVSEIAAWHLWLQTHDGNGNLLFTTNEMRHVANAAVEFRAKADPAPYAGHVVADGRFSEAEIDAFVAFAAERCPSLKEGDKMARLKAIHMPVFHKGVCYFNGFTPGTYLGKNMTWGGLVALKQCLMEKGYSVDRWHDVGWDEIDLFLLEYAPEFNACSADIAAFKARGGKIIMTTGWEDQTVPPNPIVDYYERVCERDGGIEATSGYFRLFCLPGCGHGGGKGRIVTGGAGALQLRAMLVDWCERDKAPESFGLSWEARKLTIPVPPYPGLAIQDGKGAWTVKQMPRGVARIGDVCLETKTVVGK